jgi:nicotinate phosphoribosyltransferase
VLLALKEEGHEIDVFGVGTHLVTCQSQPALGMVYKLVEIRGQPRIKLSDEKEKVTLPCKKQVYRLYGNSGTALLDLLLSDGEPVPAAGVRILARHPFEDTKRVYVTPTKVEQLTELVWDLGQAKPLPTLEEARERVKAQLATMRTDYTRFLNPTPYKVSVSNSLFDFLADLWQKELPIQELK